MPEQAESLDAIGMQVGTDKSSAHHNYLVLYERFFGPLRHAPITLQGASLKMWERYFPNASIVGADIIQDVQKYSTIRTNIVIIDLTGVSVRLNGGPQLRFDIEVVGAFAGDTNLVVAGSGQNCVFRTGQSPIRGLQIRLIPK